MSREILFKAKRLDNGEWVEGDLLRTRDSERILIFSNNIYRCDRNTLCQFTGLTDKNGKRIWENDIITISAYSYIEPEDDYTGVVLYSEELASWVLKDINNSTTESLPVCECFGSYITEIHYIGNIFADVDSQYNRNVTYDVTFVGSEEVEE